MIFGKKRKFWLSDLMYDRCHLRHRNLGGLGLIRGEVESANFQPPRDSLGVLPMLPVPNQAAPSHTALRLILGPLETRVMEVLWECNECCVRQVLPKLNHKFAYTTIMSTLDRLYKKRFANRRKCGRAYAYSARVSCQEWRDIVARDLVAKLLAGPQSSHEALIACLLEAVRLQEPELLEDIETTLQDKRGGIVSGYNGA